MKAVDPVRDGYILQAVIDRVAYLRYPLDPALTQWVGSEMSRRHRRRSNGHSPPTALHQKANGSKTTQQHRGYSPDEIAELDELIHYRAKELRLKKTEEYCAEMDRQRQIEMPFVGERKGAITPLEEFPWLA